jgi:hypothetical protein
MATYKGSGGVLRIGTTTLAELKSWTIDTTQETIDDTSMGDAWRTHIPGLLSWSGSGECHWDPTNTNGQTVLDLAGTTIGTATATFFPVGTATTATQYSGVITVNSASRTASMDGLVEATFQFTGNGTLTRTN